jgi:hypothetical protein
MAMSWGRIGFWSVAAAAICLWVIQAARSRIWFGLMLAAMGTAWCRLFEPEPIGPALIVAACLLIGIHALRHGISRME